MPTEEQPTPQQPEQIATEPEPGHSAPDAEENAGQAQGAVYSDEEEKLVQERLKNLGYL